MCIRFLKVVSHYDLSILSMPVMGLKKGIGGRGQLYQFNFNFEIIFHFPKPLASMLYVACVC